MLFNSFEFLIFLPIVFLLYWFAVQRKLQWQNGLVLIASYVFYGWWSWKFMGLLMLSTLLDYLYGFWVASTNRKKARLFLWLSIINNLGILGLFKYYNFFAAQFQQSLEFLGISVQPYFLNLALPIGISFYTFHGMSYVFDIYHGRQKPVRNFLEYGVFVSFFPLLVAGPIERASHLLPQIQKERTFNYRQAVQGLRLMLWGMFKKVVVADTLAEFVDPVFSNYSQQPGIVLLAAAVAFSFQIYGDFSGYSDIALGTAKLFGFELLSNFRFPYFSRDMAEFWRRWHISLSSWFRDYLYIPLGGSRGGKWLSIRNTFIIFLVSGFWHGASWNFIVWGGIHAVGFLPLLIMNRNRKNSTDVVAQNRIFPNGLEVFQMLSTFTFATFAWVFFRAKDLQQAIGFFAGMLDHKWGNVAHVWTKEGVKRGILALIFLIAVDWWQRHNERELKAPSNWILRFVVYLLLAAICLSNFTEDSTFIYFQF